jgi:hypothetical protein
MEISPGRYRHYKGADYQVLLVATHSETGERLVIYQALYGERGYWVRPLAMFTERVTVDGEERARFELVESATDGK